MLGRVPVQRLLANALLGIAMFAVTVVLATIVLPADLTPHITSICLSASASPLALGITTTLDALRRTSPRT